MRPGGAGARGDCDHRSVIAAILILAGAIGIGAATPGRASAAVPVDPPQPASPAHLPRLVVLLVVDQFRPDYLDRLRPRFGPDGFRRLLEGGTWFTACAIPYALTETAPGHATLATGTTPDRHGIVSNEWFDAALGRMTEAVEDPDAPLFGPAGPGASPRRLLVETIGDALRRATKGEAKVWAVAGKDRAAIFSAGLHPSGAVWYDKRNGRMVSSRYYGEAAPEWLRRFNGAHPAERLLRDIPVKDFDSLRTTPQFHDLLFDCARTLVTSERLGADDVPDLLILGLSGTDILGHAVGPFDDRLADLIVRLDAQIGSFLKFVEGRVGAGRTIVALSSDHGVAPTRAQAIASGLTPPVLDRKALRAALEAALAAAVTGDHIAPRLRGTSTRIWFDDASLAGAGMSREQAAEIAGKAASGVEGIAGWVTPSHAGVDAALAEMYRLSRYAGRSADLYLVPAEYASNVGDDPANHGTPWPYDRRVPLLFAGGPFRRGVSDDQPCTPADVAPTLAAALHIPPPAAATGRVLTAAAR